jgi:hypothetical protein
MAETAASSADLTFFEYSLTRAGYLKKRKGPQFYLRAL